MRGHGVPAEVTERRDSPAFIALLWAALLAGPITWFVTLNIQYSLVRVACTGGTMLALHLVALLALCVVAGGGWVAWREWRRAGAGSDPEGAGSVARTRFLCMVGMLGAALFSLAIAAQWLGTLFLNPCMGI